MGFSSSPWLPCEEQAAAPGMRWEMKENPRKGIWSRGGFPHAGCHRVNAARVGHTAAYLAYPQGISWADPSH